jgi:porphobilinogen deaminase
MKLRIGSRGSQLALWQANYIAALLHAQGHSAEIEIIKTTGDRLQEVTFAQVGSKGMFTKEIEEALADGRVDLAVHSLKDLPTELPEPFTLAVTPKRADPRDVFVSVRFESLAALPQGARVGTSSQRRRAQLKALRPDIEAIEFRGNVGTRLRKLAEGLRVLTASKKPSGCASGSNRKIFVRLPARERWALRLARMTPRQLRRSPSLTMRQRALQSPPSGRRLRLLAEAAKSPSAFIAGKHRGTSPSLGTKSLRSSPRRRPGRLCAFIIVRPARARTPLRWAS